MAYSLKDINFRTVADPVGFIGECDERYNALVREASAGTMTEILS